MLTQHTGITQTTSKNLPNWFKSKSRYGQTMPPQHCRSASRMEHLLHLEMLAVFLALKNFLFIVGIRGHHVLIHSDNTSVVSYINHRGVCGQVHFVNWRAKSSCGPKGSCCLFEQAYIPSGSVCVSRDISLSTMVFTSCIQLLSDWTRWCRRGWSFFGMHFPRSLCSRDSWREFAGTGF